MGALVTYQQTTYRYAALRLERGTIFLDRMLSDPCVPSRKHVGRALSAFGISFQPVYADVLFASLTTPGASHPSALISRHAVSCRCIRSHLQLVNAFITKVSLRGVFRGCLRAC